MQLDARLQAVADFVPAGARAADIGTDHAYLAVTLIQENVSARVIASDKNSGPCEAARNTVYEAGLMDKIVVRMGDGLQVLVPGEVDVACIAGMGGLLICEILSASPAIVAGLTRLVLQPMNASEKLRSWLYAHDWHIVDEALACTDGRIYEIITAEPGRKTRPEALLLSIGPILWQKKPELLQHHIESLLFKERRIAAGMEKSNEAKKSRKYKQSIKKIRSLEAKLLW